MSTSVLFATSQALVAQYLFYRWAQKSKAAELAFYAMVAANMLCGAVYFMLTYTGGSQNVWQPAGMALCMFGNLLLMAKHEKRIHSLR